MFNGVGTLLHDVRYVPELKKNLISLGQFDHSGCSFKVENGKLVVAKRSLIIMKGLRSNGFYFLDGRTFVHSVALAEIDSTRLWHLRLSHLCEMGLTKLHKKVFWKQATENLKTSVKIAIDEKLT